MNPNESKEESEDIWSKLLAAAAQSNSSAIPPGNLLILGDRNCGKSTLLARLQRKDIGNVTQESALSYTTIDVREESSEDLISIVNVWNFEGDVANKELMRFALNEQTLKEKCVVLITLNLSRPWSLHESLNKWMSLLEEHVSSLVACSDPDLQHKLREDLETRFQTYTQDIQKNPKSSKRKRVRRELLKEDKATLPPLPDGVLIRNLGIPIIIACCKSDSIDELKSDYGYKDPHFDYIQQYLRNASLSYGASLVYLSALKDKNCRLLAEYIEHLLFDLEFRYQPLFDDKDTIFVPIGEDTKIKISLLDDEVQKVCKNPNDTFDAVLLKPKNLKKNAGHSVVIECESDQSFLQRIKQKMQTDEDSPDDKLEVVVSVPHMGNTKNQNNSSSNGNTINSLNSPALSLPSNLAAPSPRKSPANKPLKPKKEVPTSPLGMDRVNGVTNPENIQQLHNFFNGLINNSSQKSTVSPSKTEKKIKSKSVKFSDNPPPKDSIRPADKAPSEKT